MDRNSVMALDQAMLEHQEMIRGVERRHMFKALSDSRSVIRFAGIRRSVGQSLIAIGERIHIDECERAAEELAGDSVSMSLSS